MKAVVLVALLVLVSAPAFAVSIFAADAIKYVGQTVTVEGTVSEVHIDGKSGTTFFDFGGRYPDSVFSGVIFASDAGTFGNVSGYGGKSVGITGTVRLYRGRPEIVLRSPNQLTAK